MLEITILGSGSSGNSCLVCSEDTRILIDAGLSARRLVERLALCGLQPSDLTGIVLTHEHGDHAAALKVLPKKFEIPVYANPLTAEAVRFQAKNVQASWNLFATGTSFSIGSLSLQSFSVPHDAADPVGFVITNRSVRFAILTDLGMITRSVVHMTTGADAVLIETNYDEKMLEADTKRPWSVKQRIASRHGHLSNHAAAELLTQIATDRLQTVILGHMSEDCNCAASAREIVESELRRHGHVRAAVHCAPRSEISPRFVVQSVPQALPEKLSETLQETLSLF